MIETGPQRPPGDENLEQGRLDRIEAMLDVARGQISAHAIVVDLLLKALAAVDRDSSVAIAMALEVAEMDLVDFQGETETVLALRHIHEQLRQALPPGTA